MRGKRLWIMAATVLAAVALVGAPASAATAPPSSGADPAFLAKACDATRDHPADWTVVPDAGQCNGWGGPW
jgi:hypothetical protein